MIYYDTSRIYNVICNIILFHLFVAMFISCKCLRRTKDANRSVGNSNGHLWHHGTWTWAHACVGCVMMRQSMKSDPIRMDYSILFVYPRCPENFHAVQIHEKHWLAYNLTMKLDPSGFSTNVCNEHHNTFLLSFAECDDPPGSWPVLASWPNIQHCETGSLFSTKFIIEILRWWLYARWQWNVPPQASHRNTKRYKAPMSCDCLWGHGNRKNWNSLILYSARNLKRTLDLNMMEHEGA